ncbi:MAG: exodeoxyribonuclease VII large subunit [Candidatus Pelagibacter sp.]|nr:exodeoxyribonuclease VII large subunit [Candidatus Pelagibacter sp.]OUV87732.1 MAG: exodeoxyribonuclease VII large subunit [Pelagibacteraceae bacterium TMED136]|tara:strand:+ start:6213 stop:7409 length:1197 start_codon:yes stop_codon:yes gene_type:complete
MNNIPEFSVTEISNLTKNILEENFNLIRVKGEISSLKNFKGHLYFSIKDDTHILNAVCWASKVPSLEVQPEDGIEIVAEGKISSYSKGSISSYQLQINQIEIKGEGALLKLFEQRKKKLEREGLFLDQYKKKLPLLPKNIGVITSPSGAVIMDIIDRIQARFPTNIKLYPTSVQGVNACKEIIEGLNYFEKKKNVNVVIIARGGGGIEDFIPFNEEKLIRRVFEHKIPIISAIGHETDFTLLDFVADLRAATPTAAAELIVPELKNLKEKLNYLSKNLLQKTKYFINNNIKELKNINSVLAIKNFKKISLHYSNIIKNLTRTINFAMISFLKLRDADLEIINSSLKNLNIENTLKRGFVMLKDVNGKFIKTSKKLEKNSLVNIQFYNELIKANIKIKK